MSDPVPGRIPPGHSDTAATALWAVSTAVPAIAACFHFYRGAPIDGVVFSAVALVCLAGRRTDAAPARVRAAHPPVRLTAPWTILVNYFLSTSGPAAEQDHPPLSDVVTSLFDSDYRRLVLALVWLWLGVGLLEALGVLRVVRTGGVAPGDGAAGRPGAAR